MRIAGGEFRQKFRPEPHLNVFHGDGVVLAHSRHLFAGKQQVPRLPGRQNILPHQADVILAALDKMRLHRFAGIGHAVHRAIGTRPHGDTVFDLTGLAEIQIFLIGIHTASASFLPEITAQQRSSSLRPALR